MNTLTTLLAEVSAYTDRDAYISDLALSSMWGDGPDDDIPADRLALLGRIWDFAHMDFRAIRQASGLSMTAIAARFDIPYRTVQDWDAGRRTPPPYVLRMIAEILGLLPNN